MNYKLIKEAIKPVTCNLEEIDKNHWFLVGGSLFVRTGATSMRNRDLVCCNDVTNNNSIQLPKTTQVTPVKVTVLVEEIEDGTQI